MLAAAANIATAAVFPIVRQLNFGIWRHRKILCALTLQEVRELLQEYGDQSAKEHTHRCDECHGSLNLFQFYQVDPDKIKEVLTVKQEFGQSNLAASEDFTKKIQEHHSRVAEVLARYEEALGPLPPPGSSKKLVRSELELKPEYQDERITSRGYPCSKEDQDKIMRQVLELVEAGMCEAYKDTEIPEHCSPCFLVGKPGSTAKRLVVDYRKLNKNIKVHAGSLRVMENTMENAASCKFKSKIDKRSGLWQLDLTERGKELMAIRTPNGRVF